MPSQGQYKENFNPNDYKPSHAFLHDRNHTEDTNRDDHIISATRPNTETTDHERGEVLAMASPHHLLTTRRTKNKGRRKRKRKCKHANVKVLQEFFPNANYW